MSYCNNKEDHMKEGLDDYERFGRYDYSKYNDHFDDCNKYYTEGYDRAEQREQERREERRELERIEYRQDQARRERAESEEDYYYQMEQEEYYRNQPESPQQEPIHDNEMPF